MQCLSPLTIKSLNPRSRVSASPVSVPALQATAAVATVVTAATVVLLWTTTTTVAALLAATALAVTTTVVAPRLPGTTTTHVTTATDRRHPVVVDRPSMTTLHRVAMSTTATALRQARLPVAVFLPMTLTRT
jgi:hypothetical protein